MPPGSPSLGGRPIPSPSLDQGRLGASSGRVWGVHTSILSLVGSVPVRVRADYLGRYRSVSGQSKCLLSRDWFGARARGETCGAPAVSRRCARGVPAGPARGYACSAGRAARAHPEGIAARRRTSCATSRRPLFLPGQSLRQYSRCAGSAGASSESTGPMSVVQAPFGGVAGGGGLRRRAASGRSQGGRRRRWRKAESVRRSCVALQIVVFSSAGDIHPPLPPCIRWLSCIHCHIRVA